MAEKLKIKIIKKGQAVKAATPSPSATKTKRESAREMVSNVSSWVHELQTRKRDETKMAFEQLFATRTQPNET